MGKKPNLLRKAIDFVGRIFLTFVFIVSIPTKITKFSFIVQVIVEKGIPNIFANFLLIAAIFCIIIGSFFLIFLDQQRLGAVFLLIFLIPTTILFHLFPFQSKAVFMNMGLIGGLTLVATRPKMIE